MSLNQRSGPFLVLCVGLLSNGLASGESVTLLDMKAEVPDVWQAEQPTSMMRQLQYEVPGSEGIESARFVVYYFGPGQGGNLSDNIARWESQFSNPDGGPVEAAVTQIEGAAMPTTLVELEGSYARSVGIGQEGEALPNRMLLAGLIETPQGNLYPQLHGPADVVEAHREHFIGFLKSIDASGDGPTP